MIESLRSMSCKQIYASAAIAGAASIPTGVDKLFSGYGAPPPIHWALAGVAVDTLCRGQMIPQLDQETLMAAAAGYGGAYAFQMLAPKLKLF